MSMNVRFNFLHWICRALFLLVVCSGMAFGADNYQLDYSSYLGGNGPEQTRDIAVDAQGNFFIVGGIQTGNFQPTIGPGSQGNYDVFLIKFGPDCRIIWSRLLGGPNYDRAYAVELAPDGSIYVGGRAGIGFPTTPGVVQPNFGGDPATGGPYGRQDAFIAKFAPNGASLWATYFGGDDGSIFRDITVDAAGNVYGMMTHAKADCPHITPGAFQTTRPNGSFAVICKISPSGQQVIWATYLGGTENLDAMIGPAIRLDSKGYVVVSGCGPSTTLPTTVGAYDRTENGSSDMFVAKFTPDGSTMVFGTYLGGSSSEGGDTHNLAVDGQDNIIVAAVTQSADFPTTPNAFQRVYGGGGGEFNQRGDGFVARLSSDGSHLLASTYLGGNSGEGLEGVVVDGSGAIYVSGGTHSTNFPTTANAYQRTNQGDADLFVSKLSPDLTQLLFSSLVGGNSKDLGLCIAVSPDGSIISSGQTGCQFTNPRDNPSTNFPAVNALFSTTRGGIEDMILVRFKPVSSAEIDVTRNAAPMADNGSDSISGTIAGTSTVLNYQISNTGNAALTLGTVSLGTLINCTATVVTAPASSVAPGGVTTLSISIKPTAAGAWSCNPSFTTNDADENPTNWALSGTAANAPAPEVDVTRNGVSIVDGGTDAVASSMAGVPLSLSYQISNTGNATLTVGSASLGVLSNCSATITVAPAASVVPGGTTTLSISITPSAVGTWSCNPSFTTNDTNENPTIWVIQGAAAVSNTTAHWPLDEGTGLIAHDVSGNGSDATLNGNPVWIPGQINSALNFDGVGSYLRVNNESVFDYTGNMTIALWLKRNHTLAKNERLINKPIGQFYKPTFAFQFANNGTLGANFYSTDGKWIDVPGGNSVVDTSWHHAALVLDFSNNIGRVYVDGVEVGNASLQGRIPMNGNSPVFIGAGDATHEHFSGALDDIRFYKRALDASEIATLGAPAMRAQLSALTLDADNDGLSNGYEAANGLDPLTADSNGNGILDGDEQVSGTGVTHTQAAKTWQYASFASPVPASQKLRVLKLAGRARFNPSGKDVLNATLELPEKFSMFADAVICVDAGGGQAYFTLDKSGRSRNELGSVKLAKSRDGLNITIAKLALRNGTYAGSWATGLDITRTARNEKSNLPLSVTIPASRFEENLLIQYSASQGKISIKF